MNFVVRFIYYRKNSFGYGAEALMLLINHTVAGKSEMFRLKYFYFLKCKHQIEVLTIPGIGWSGFN